MAKASGNKELEREARESIKNLTSKYHQLSKASGLPTKMERMSSIKGKSVDNFRKSGIIKLNRESGPQDFKPLDSKRRDKMFEKLRKQGVDIVTGKEAIAYLDYKSRLEGVYVEASSIGNMMFFRDNPSASAVFEETIHLKQFRDGRISTNLSVINQLEIEAAQKMIKYQKAYGITEEEIKYTKQRLSAMLGKGE